MRAPKRVIFAWLSDLQAPIECHIDEYPPFGTVDDSQKIAGFKKYYRIRDSLLPTFKLIAPATSRCEEKLVSDQGGSQFLSLITT
jgi:hypothetical protein